MGRGDANQHYNFVRALHTHAKCGVMEARACAYHARLLLLFTMVASASAHSSLLIPASRNALIDAGNPKFHDGKVKDVRFVSPTCPLAPVCCSLRQRRALVRTASLGTATLHPTPATWAFARRAAPVSPASGKPRHSALQGLVMPVLELEHHCRG